MPVGGLTTLVKTMNTKREQQSDQVSARGEKIYCCSPKSAVDFTIKVMKMERERHFSPISSWQLLGPAQASPRARGMENIVRGIQSQGRFADRKVAFEGVADDRIDNIPYQRVKSKFLSLIRIYDATDISCHLLLSKLNDPGEITRCETT